MKIKFSLLGIALAVTVLFLAYSMPDAYAAIPTIVSAQITDRNTITIVYSEPVLSTLADYSDLQLTNAGPRTPLAVLGTGTSTITITFSGNPVDENESGTIDINNPLPTLVSVSTVEALALQDDLLLLDGQANRGSFALADVAGKITDRFRNLTPSLVSLSNVELFSAQSASTSSFSSQQENNFVRVDEPAELKLKIPEYSTEYLDEVRLYLNLRSPEYLLHQSDTYVIHNKFKPLEIVDPHGYFSEVKVTNAKQEKDVEYTFEIIFAKEMDESNMIIQFIDRIRNSRTLEFSDALNVVGVDFVVEKPTPEALIIEQTPSRYEQVLLENQDSAISLFSADESLHDWFMVMRHPDAIKTTPDNSQENISSGIKKQAYYWANQMLPEREFAKSIQYLVINGHLEPSQFISFEGTTPDWMKKNNQWWSNPSVVSDEQFLSGISSIISQ